MKFDTKATSRQIEYNGIFYMVTIYTIFIKNDKTWKMLSWWGCIRHQFAVQAIRKLHNNECIESGLISYMLCRIFSYLQSTWIIKKIIKKKPANMVINNVQMHLSYKHVQKCWWFRLCNTDIFYFILIKMIARMLQSL